LLFLLTVSQPAPKCVPSLSFYFEVLRFPFLFLQHETIARKHGSNTLASGEEGRIPVTETQGAMSL
jgi:hypothetical protein